MEPTVTNNQNIATAATLKDDILERAHKMTLLPSSHRFELLSECHPTFEKMRRLNADHFGSSPLLYHAIDDLERELCRIANLGGGNISGDSSSGDGACPFCHTQRTDSYCLPCLRPILPALTVLEEEFNTGGVATHH